MTDIIVVGGGAAGCMAAIQAARAGAQVMILDHSPVILKKILATGNGKCNFTNIEQGSSYYYCDDPAFVLHTLKCFSATDAVDFFRSLGVLHKEKNGYCYPITDQAVTVRSSLLSELNRLHIKIQTDVGIRAIQKDDKGFLVDTKQGVFRCKACILATGGKASPKTGSDGTGYIYARKLGLKVNTPVPALTAVCGACDLIPAIAGVRTDGKVSIYVNGSFVKADIGELQWTDYGISGIPVFQISRIASLALHEKQDVVLKMDFFPAYTEEELSSLLADILSNYEDTKTWNEVLYGLIHSKISDAVCEQMHIKDVSVSMHSVKTINKLIQRLVSYLKEINLYATDVKGFDRAQVTCGGVDIGELYDTMEAKKLSGLFLAGEIIDVDAICGGYNLQWAWSSGYLAGIHATEYINER